MAQDDYHDTFWRALARQFLRHWLGMAALVVIALFVLVGVYAPFLASSKPLVVFYDGSWYFPLFRYLFYRGFFTTRLDLFFNLMIFTLPLFLLTFLLKRLYRNYAMTVIATAQIVLFLFVAFRHGHDPQANPRLLLERLKALQPPSTNEKANPLLAHEPFHSTWQFELDHLSAYAKLNQVLEYHLSELHNEKLQKYEPAYDIVIEKRLGESAAKPVFPTVWAETQHHEKEQIASLSATLEANLPSYREAKQALQKLRNACQNNAALEACGGLDAMPPELRSRILSAVQTVLDYDDARSELQLLRDKRAWLSQQSRSLAYMIMPLFRPFHWEDDAGGDQALNELVPWWELTRTDRKDLTAGLIFGVRISIVVGISAVLLALLIGVPFGCLAGYYAGITDIVACRVMEIWEAMPTFFMLLLVVAITQSKSIFLVIAIIGLFGWTGFSRYIRGEFFKQRHLPYVEACKAQGFDDGYIIFKHILPNAIPPVLTLLPFAIMGAISTEAGLSFLGLGEEGSCSWGVLMDEGRRAFPGESYLLWPPAILLTLLLVAIALVGDALRDCIDPRLHK